MKRTLIVAGLVLCVGLSACEPIATVDQLAYIEVKDAQGNKVQTLTFSAEGGEQVLYIQTTLPRWLAFPMSLHEQLHQHPLPDSQGYIETNNMDAWMTLRYRHAPATSGGPLWMDLFNGTITVRLSQNDGLERTEDIYIWNDDIPANLTKAVYVTIIQEAGN
jgi:hypothetical protein